MLVESSFTCFSTTTLPTYFGGLSTSDYEINAIDAYGDYIIFAGTVYNYPTTPV
jgi:hypothetical protein